MRSPIRYIGAIAAAVGRAKKKELNCLVRNPADTKETTISKKEFYDRISKGLCGECGGDGGGDGICEECRHLI